MSAPAIIPIGLTVICLVVLVWAIFWPHKPEEESTHIGPIHSVSHSPGSINFPSGGVNNVYNRAPRENGAVYQNDVHIGFAEVSHVVNDTISFAQFQLTRKPVPHIPVVFDEWLIDFGDLFASMQRGPVNKQIGVNGATGKIIRKIAND
ncbi:hypothetical protein [Sphingomonas sp. M1A8_2b]